MQYVKHTVGESRLEAMQELSHDHWSYSTHSTLPRERAYVTYRERNIPPQESMKYNLT